ncbi:MAG TPA: hypothetical protein VGF75_07210 [Candidatus Saccharimonadales bacterium]
MSEHGARVPGGSVIVLLSANVAAHLPALKQFKQFFGFSFVQISRSDCKVVGWDEGYTSAWNLFFQKTSRTITKMFWRRDGYELSLVATLPTIPPNHHRIDATMDMIEKTVHEIKPKAK